MFVTRYWRKLLVLSNKQSLSQVLGLKTIHIFSQIYILLLSESCQESSALHFVTSLGIADLIGDGEATLAELSKKADVEPQFLGTLV
jgi:hypothetical protein